MGREPAGKSADPVPNPRDSQARACSPPPGSCTLQTPGKGRSHPAFFIGFPEGRGFGPGGPGPSPPLKPEPLLEEISSTALIKYSTVEEALENVIQDEDQEVVSPFSTPAPPLQAQPAPAVSEEMPPRSVLEKRAEVARPPEPLPTLSETQAASPAPPLEPEPALSEERLQRMVLEGKIPAPQVQEPRPAPASRRP